jgi:Nif-specific regulatory protein
MLDKTTSSLVEISKTINSILALDELLERIMDLAIREIGIERGILFLKTSDGDLEPRVARNVEKETLVNAEEISRSITTEVAATGKYFLSSNIQDDPHQKHRQSVKDFKIQSVLCVPMILRDTIIGTIYLDSRKATKTFTNSDIQFMQTFANLAAVAIENAKLYETTKREAEYWKEEAGRASGFEKIIYVSQGMDKVCKTAKSVANTTVSVLISGESGTGKELIARAIHYNSPRREKKFIPINCSALPEHILESELFGAKRGAFTGAVADKKGLFEEADGGTIFLDEIADMQPALQAKLLRVLQEGEIRRVGDTQYRYVNVRVLSATNKDIKKEIQEGKFREDLYYRLCGVEIHIPPLRERREDILPLTQYFIREFCNDNNLPQATLAKDVQGILEQYTFPGNVRELQNVVRKAVILGGTVITADDFNLPRVSSPSAAADDFSEATRQHIIRVLEKVGWNQSRAAELLGLNRTTLQAKMKKLNIVKS